MRRSAVAIDFSRADATQRNLDACAAAGVPLLIGTTGLTDATLAHIDALAKRIPILVSANTSLGLNVLVELVRRAAASLPAGFDIEIFESHHRHKIDAPSGTALALVRAGRIGRGPPARPARFPRQPDRASTPPRLLRDARRDVEANTSAILRSGNTAHALSLLTGQFLPGGTGGWPLAGQSSGRDTRAEFIFES